MQVAVASTSKVNVVDHDDFTYLCRICAVKTHNIIPLFSKDGDDQHLVEKINKYLPIKVCNDDLLPAGVCEQCSNAVLAWHELVECCVQADVSFQNRLALSQKQGLSQSTPGIPSNSDPTLNENGIKWTDSNYVKEDFIQSYPQYDNDISFRISPPNDCTSDHDDEPLSRVAAANHTMSSYEAFYAALVNFRNHYVKQHKQGSLEFTESSTEEEIEQLGYVEYDDLSKSNMRRDRMDDRTRIELNEVQSKINGKVYYTCKVCGKNLSSAHTYLFHKNIHTGERPCVCHVCGKSFRAPSGLQRHLKETHERVKRYVCALCAKTFVNSQNLRQHMRIHTGERPYVCAQCGKRFTQSGSLHVHLKTHSDLFPFNCTECGAQFRLRSGLMKHKLKHTGERPHVCVNCGKGFRQKHELNSHSLTHTNAKPFACSLCGAAFRQRRALRHHCKRLHESRETANTVYAQGPY
ncbi:zinc finger protein 37 homolog isoform X3 [Pieris rapae]|uniref:zinc finger protein 37 homolog isoform X3 n=1 Tax=Pieris rapae TaxID=64459 RepID=UPI001E27CF73|nr:zinc finger protein 37 homolog isoform X3 [Pieris rapae]